MKIRQIIYLLAIGIIVGLSIPHIVPAISNMCEREVCYGHYIVLQYKDNNVSDKELFASDLKKIVLRGQYYNRVKDQVLWENDFSEYRSESDSLYIDVVNTKFNETKGGAK